MASLNLVVVFVLLSVSSCSAKNPGLVLQFSKSGLNYINGIALDLITKDLQGKQIPDQHGEADVKIGKIKYDVTNIQLKSFNKPQATVTFAPGKGATWKSSGGSGSLHGDWHYKAKIAFIPISDSGSFDVDVSDFRFSVTFQFGLDVATGRPTISAPSCKADIGKVSIHIHSGASWLYNLFKGKIEDLLKDSVNKLLCKAATKAVNENAEKSLRKLKVDTKIGNLLSLDYRLTTRPEFDTEHLTSFHKGECFFTKNRQPVPFQAPTFPHTGGSRMVTIWLSQYIATSAAFAAQTNGVLRYNLTAKDLKSDHAYLLHTTCVSGKNCIGKLIPEIGKKFPNKTVVIDLYSTSTPSVKIEEGKVNIVFRGNMIFYLAEEKQKHFIFSANATLTTAAEAFIKSKIIKGKLKDTRVEIDVLNSTLAQPRKFLKTSLKLMLSVVMNDFILPKINSIGEKGVPVPSVDNAGFTNTNITFVSNAIKLETDVEYQPIQSKEQVVTEDVEEVRKSNTVDETLKFLPKMVKFAGKLANGL